MIARNSRPASRGWQLARQCGFTLVELMVVVAIIGVLAGFITAAAIGAINKAREAAVSAELASMSMAVETYKQKYGSYPPNLQDLPAVRQHILKLFPRCKDTLPSPYTLSGTNGPSLVKITGITPGSNVTSYQLAGSAVSIGTWERTAAIHCLPFWLSGFYPDPEHPLSPPQTNTSTDAQPVYTTNATRVSFFDFKPGRLRPTGVAYIAAPKATFTPGNIAINISQTFMLNAYFPEGIDCPYVYFNSSRYDARDQDPLATYSYPALNADGTVAVDSSGRLTPVHLRYARYLDSSVGGDDLVLLTLPLTSAGVKPEYSTVINNIRTGSVAIPYRASKIGPYVNPNSFQIVNAGLDNMYSGILTGKLDLVADGMVEINNDTPGTNKITRGNLYTATAYYPGAMWWYPNGPEAQQSTIADAKLMRGSAPQKDNLTNFAKGRLEQEMP